MRILELTGEPIANGGQEAFIVNFLSALDMDGICVDVLTLYECENKHYKAIIEGKGCRLFELNLNYNPGHSRKDCYKALKHFLKENRYDVVHIHSGSISVLMYAAKAAKKSGVKKIIVHSHCAADKKSLKYRLIKLVSYSALRTCPTDYCACSQLAGDWKFSKKIAKNKLKIIKNGVDIQKFIYDNKKDLQIRNACKIAKDAFVIGHVGRFSYQKNHEFLIEVFKEVKKRIPGAILLLIGTGVLMDEVRGKVEEYGLCDSVVFAGNVNNVNDYMQAMNVFVLPSRFEGLPVVGVEAQAAGLPMLVSDRVTEEIKLCESVKFLPLGNVSLWVEELCALSGAVKTDNTVVLTESGYNIQNTAKIIKEMYLN